MEEHKRLEEVTRIRFTSEQIAWLNQIARESGMTRSQVVRYLVDNATVRPAVIRTEIEVDGEREKV